MEEISRLAVDATLKSIMAYCKFLAANDTRRDKIKPGWLSYSRHAQEIMFSEAEFRNEHIQKKDIKVRDGRNDFTTDGPKTKMLQPVESKHEFRLTSWSGLPVLMSPEYTELSFVLDETDDVQYEGYILNTEIEIKRISRCVLA
jgi:hypothetical protein